MLRPINISNVNKSIVSFGTGNVCSITTNTVCTNTNQGVSQTDVRLNTVPESKNSTNQASGSNDTDVQANVNNSTSQVNANVTEDSVLINTESSKPQTSHINDVVVTDFLKVQKDVEAKIYLGTDDVTDFCRREKKTIDKIERRIFIGTLDITDKCQWDEKSIKLGGIDISSKCTTKAIIKQETKEIIMMGNTDMTAYCEIKYVPKEK